MNERQMPATEAGKRFAQVYASDTQVATPEEDARDLFDWIVAIEREAAEAVRPPRNRVKTPEIFSGIKRVKSLDGVVYVEFFGGTTFDIAWVCPAHADRNVVGVWLAGQIERALSERQREAPDPGGSGAVSRSG